MSSKRGRSVVGAERPAAPELQAAGRVSAVGSSPAAAAGASRRSTAAPKTARSAPRAATTPHVAPRGRAQTSRVSASPRRVAERPPTPSRKRSGSSSAPLAAKSPKRARSIKASSSAEPGWVGAERAAGEDLAWASANLTPTDDFGIWLNAAGVRVNRYGVSVDFAVGTASLLDRERAVLSGRVAETPAEVLKVAALDRDLPLSIRLDAAKNAAPYYDRKQPQAVDGGTDPATGAVIPLFDLTKMSGLSVDELTQLRALIAKAGGETAA